MSDTWWRGQGIPVRSYYREGDGSSLVVIFLVLLVVVGVLLFMVMTPKAEAYTVDEIADAIYLAEGGAKTSHPYGILTHYKTTSPRQACINTIKHALRDWDGKGDFIEFLQKRYAPIGVANDPTNLNVNWLKNVRYFLARGAA